MEHSEAIRVQAVEKYLLGELCGETRDQFEDHYFSCAECADEIRAGATFLEAAKKTLASSILAEGQIASPNKPFAPWLTGWLRPQFVVPALAGLLVFVVYQNTITIPQLKSVASSANTPRTLKSYSLIAQNSRGAAPLTIQVPPASPFSLFVDIPPENKFPVYVCQVVGESGAPEFSLRVSAAEARETVQLLIPNGLLRPGKHTLEIRGQALGASAQPSGPPVASYSFVLEFLR